MPKVTIYHNPRCSKSRQTFSLLEAEGAEVEVIEYLKDPPTPQQLDEICQRLGLEPQELLRKKEPRLKELGVAPTADMTRDEWLQLMSENPILIERPIVLRGGKAVLGRPPENVRELL